MQSRSDGKLSDSLGRLEEPSRIESVFSSFSTSIARGVTALDLGAPSKLLDQADLNGALNRLINKYGLFDSKPPTQQECVEEAQILRERVAIIELAVQTSLQREPLRPFILNPSDVLMPLLEKVLKIPEQAQNVLSQSDRGYIAISVGLTACQEVLYDLQRALKTEALMPLIDYEPLQDGAGLVGLGSILCARAPRPDVYGLIFKAPLELDKDKKRVDQLRDGSNFRFKAELNSERLGELLLELAITKGYLADVGKNSVRAPLEIVAEIVLMTSLISSQLASSDQHGDIYCKSLLSRFPRTEAAYLEPSTAIFVEELRFLKDTAFRDCEGKAAALCSDAQELNNSLSLGKDLREKLAAMQRLQLVLLTQLKLADPFYPITLRLKGGANYGEQGSDGLPMHRRDNLTTVYLARLSFSQLPLLRSSEADTLSRNPMRSIFGLAAEFTTHCRDVGELTITRHQGGITPDNLVALDFALLTPDVQNSVLAIAAEARRRIESNSSTTLREVDPVKMPSRPGALFFSVSGPDGAVLGFSQIVLEHEHFLNRPQFELIPKEKLPPGKPAEGTIIVLDPKVREISGKHEIYQALNQIHADEARKAGCNYLIIRVDVSPENPAPKKSAEKAGFRPIGHAVEVNVSGSDGVVRKIPFEWYCLELDK